MRWFSRHPDLERLSRFLDHEDDKERDRVAAHLAHCGRCRRALAFLRDLREASGEDAGHTPPEGLREQIVADRRSGNRVVLPAGDPPGARRALPVRGIVAAAVVLLVAAGLLARLPSASAHDVGGELTLTPKAPTRGATIHATYRPGATLEHHAPLVLRARFRTPHDPPYNHTLVTRTAAVLRREGKMFSATFQLPDSVVYAVFAVEDTAADVVDDNYGQFWELIVSNSSGKPLLAGLDERAKDMMGRNAEAGFSTAQRMVREYPNDLDSWAWLQAFQSWLGWTDVDSVRAMHAAKARAFDRRLRARASVPDSLVGQMYWYVASLGTDSAMTVRWRDRLMRQAPSNSFAVQERLFEILRGLGQSHDTAAAMAAFDTLWTRAPKGRLPEDRLLQVGGLAYSIALATKRPGLIHTWSARVEAGERTDAGRHQWARQVASDLAGTDVPALRQEGLRGLRQELGWLARPHPEARGLGQTRAERQDDVAATRRRLLGSLGRALIATGERKAGLDTLALAASAGWDPDLFRTIASGRLAAGDTTGALGMDALIAADPRTDSTFARSIEPLVEHVGERAWKAQLDSARIEFAHRMLARSVSKSPQGSVTLVDSSGARHDLSNLTQGHVAVVVFWSRFCGAAVQALLAIDSTAERLRREGVPVESIVEEAWSPALQHFVQDKDLRMPVYSDSKGNASKAFNNWGTPQYYVLDRRGRIRFEGVAMSDAVAQVQALRMESNR